MHLAHAFAPGLRGWYAEACGLDPGWTVLAGPGGPRRAGPVPCPPRWDQDDEVEQADPLTREQGLGVSWENPVCWCPEIAMC